MSKIQMAKRKKLIVEFIEAFSNEHHFPPSIRQIGKYIGVESISLISHYLDSLIEDGILGKENNICRAIWIKG